MSVLFVADFYKDQINGGGENNDAVLIKDLLSRDIVVERAYTRNLEKADLDSCDTIIISNFVLLKSKSTGLNMYLLLSFVRAARSTNWIRQST